MVTEALIGRCRLMREGVRWRCLHSNLRPIRSREIKRLREAQVLQQEGEVMLVFRPERLERRPSGSRSGDLELPQQLEHQAELLGVVVQEDLILDPLEEMLPFGTENLMKQRSGHELQGGPDE